MDGKDSNDGTHLSNVILLTTSDTVFLFTYDTSPVIQNATAVAKDWCSVMSRVEDEFGSRCVAIVTDSPNVHRSAAKIFQIAHPEITWIPCLAHCLNLFFKDSTVFPELQSLWQTTKKIVHLFRARTVPRALLRAELVVRDYPGKVSQNPLKGVKNVCELRFGNIFLVLQRLLLLRCILKVVCVSPAFELWCDSLKPEIERDAVKKVVAQVLSAVFWNEVDDYVRVMDPVYTLLRTADSDQTFIGSVYVRMAAIQNRFDDFTPSELPLPLMSSLKSAWVDRWNKSHIDLYSAGTPNFVVPVVPVVVVEIMFSIFQ
jgi:hypothetical protein